jgi:hypothetical protein
VRPELRRNNGTITNSSGPQGAVKPERTTSQENRWNGSKLCIFVMRELSNTVAGSCATAWIFAIVKICVEPPGATRNSPERSLYLTRFRRWSRSVTVSGNEVLEMTNSLVLISQVQFSIVSNEKTKKITYHPQKIENTFPRPTPWHSQ